MHKFCYLYYPQYHAGIIGSYLYGYKMLLLASPHVHSCFSTAKKYEYQTNNVFSKR